MSKTFITDHTRISSMGADNIRRCGKNGIVCIVVRRKTI